VAGAWQLRPWPAADADLDDVLAERYDEADRAAEREARLQGWARGDLLAFAVREITTGACVAEVLVRISGDGTGAIEVHRRPWPAVEPGGAADVDSATAVVVRWAQAALGLSDLSELSGD
jgi:hypothetical protein